MISLEKIKRTHPIILSHMKVHYSQPKGFVGRNICYLIMYNDLCYGSIVGGSATRFLPGRNEFFKSDLTKLNNIINNIFYHLDKPTDKYPERNFSSQVLKIFRKKIKEDWENRYNNEVIGFESLVELPRTGECYRRDGWSLVGQTHGFTCKRIAGEGTDSWSGKRIWDTKNLKPKLVFCKKVV